LGKKGPSILPTRFTVGLERASFPPPVSLLGLKERESCLGESLPKSLGERGNLPERHLPDYAGRRGIPPVYPLPLLWAIYGPASLPVCVPLMVYTCSTSIKQSGVHSFRSHQQFPPSHGQKGASFPARINPSQPGNRREEAKKPATESTRVQ